MYYLRKEPYVGQLCLANGQTLKVEHEDRAIYVAENRLYRQAYPIPAVPMELFRTRSRQAVQQAREAVYEASGEWFDVYGDHGRVKECEIS